MALGLLVAGMLQCIILFPGTFPSLKMRGMVPVFHPELKPIVGGVVPVTLSLLPFTALGSISIFWASGLPVGSISFLGYSQNFAGFLSVAMGSAVAVVTFPYMADDKAEQRVADSLGMFVRRLRYVFLLTAVGAVILFILREPILEIVYQRGAFDTSSIQGIAGVLPWYLVAAVCISCANLLLALYYSMDDVLTLAKLGVILPFIFFIFAGIFSRWLSYEGIGVAYAGVWLLYLVVSLLLAGSEKYGLW